MYNDLLRIGPVTIHGYGLMIGLGILAAIWLADARAPRHGLDRETTWRIIFISLAAGLVGAKLLFYIVNFREIVADPSLLLDLGNGLVVYGGILAGVPAAWLYCRRKKAPFTAYFDLLIPSVSLAQGFGRIGCFLAGCCYGRETDSWCHIVFSHSDYAPNGIALYPTQLLSAAGDFAITAVLLLLARRRPRAGTVAATYLLLYGIGRFLIEFLRDDPRGTVLQLSTSQFISVFIALGGALLALRIRNKPAPEGGGGPAARDGTENVDGNEENGKEEG
ncbi:MAG: prolipoprotein diacylglyceryl transferase [Clostridia bacterium]|nr:prolipoprotein diacylglyceryl transferase [Clostridia bacterium]